MMRRLAWSGFLCAVSLLAPTEGGRIDAGTDERGPGVILDGTLPFTEINFKDLGVDYARTDGCTIKKEEVAEGEAPCWRGEWVQWKELECPEGDTPVSPLARRELVEDGSWSRWVLVTEWSCPGESEDLVDITINEVRRLPVALPSVVVQPDGGRALVQMETIFHSPDAGEQGFSARVVGQVVDLVVRPVAQDWDFGDGARWTGNDPGTPWPDYTVHRVYDQLGTFATTLATTWGARYRVDGGAWQDVEGTITTDVTGEPVEIVERRTYLVAPD